MVVVINSVKERNMEENGIGSYFSKCGHGSPP